MDDWGEWADELDRAHGGHPNRPARCPRCGRAFRPAGYRKQRVSKGSWEVWLYWKCPGRFCGKIEARKLECPTR